MREYKINVDGLNIHCIEEGDGSPILLLHGGTLGYSADLWRSVMPELATAGHRVVSYDQPGFGRSDPPPEFGLLYRQKFIANVIAALDLRRPLLVGHSQAGGLVVGAVLEKPQLFCGVVIMGTGSLLPPLGTPSKDVDIPQEEPSIDDTRALLEENLFHHAVITSDLLEEYHAMSIGRNFHNAVQRARASAGGPKGGSSGKRPLWEQLADIEIPSLFIYGANDRASAALRVRLARERFPKLTYHLLSDCHHIIQWDQPKILVRLILEFMATTRLMQSGH